MNGFCLLTLAALWPGDGGAPTSAPATAVTSSAPALDAKIDAILTDMETTGAKVETLRCKVKHIVDGVINIGDHNEREGEIVYQTARPHPRFFITFTSESEGMGEEAIRRSKKTWYLLENLWLTIVKEEVGEIHKIQLARPGEDVDFFDINKAPFPFPFGQKKRPMLEQFDIVLAKPAKDEQHLDHLVCLPKPGAPVADQWEKIDYYVLKDLHLPMRIVAVEKGGDNVIKAIFPDLSADSLKAKVGDKDFEPPPEWRGYGKPIIETLDGAPPVP